MQDVLTKSVSQVYHFEDKKQNNMKKANKEDIVANIKEEK